MFRLVILDSDGVLVESGDIEDSVVAAVLNAAGIAATAGDVGRISIGMTDDAMWDALEAAFGQKILLDTRLQYERLLLERLEQHTTSIPHVDVALSCLHRMGLQLCVASNGTHEKMRVTLGVTGLSRHFMGSIFSASDVTHGKPYPDLFLRAAERMGVAPSESVVVEDSLIGVEAGIAAGMTVFHYCPKRSLPRVSHEQVVVFESFLELPCLIEMHSSKERAT